MAKGVRYDAAQKEQVVRSILSEGRTVAALALETGISRKTIQRWVDVQRAGEQAPEPLRPDHSGPQDAPSAETSIDTKFAETENGTAAEPWIDEYSALSASRKEAEPAETLDERIKIKKPRLTAAQLRAEESAQAVKEQILAECASWLVPIGADAIEQLEETLTIF